ncbi:class I SAM-dependent methyltransferase [Thiomicrorhabdus xiamenensis]|uniref:Methyltransferase domain-containing protein n=1 Tax=Thiomicrorhabdus xiamenensis TaxID=2739063 RepID=A0A7D4NQP1_9GAMM|nr:methyltransferase domain-containing protein [Thiomicrorhabdus xiamenensis]QKI89371.1 methyltransferase domain-containing protein [Thiomicrorhabdus xiamenensis]
MSTSFQQLLKRQYASSGRCSVYEHEKQLIDSALNKLFGYFLLQVGSISNEDMLQHSRVNAKVLLDCVYPPASVLENSVHFVLADLDFLPIGHDKVDVILLPHTLETAEDPHYLLRQLDAMLLPEGHVVISGFNPKGCWVWRNKWLHTDRLFEQAHLFAPSKLKDWLSVLGYEITLENYSPIQCASCATKEGFWGRVTAGFEKVLCRLGFQFGNVYCLVAKKKVDAPTLVGLKWHMPRWQSIRGGALNSTKIAGAKCCQQANTVKTNNKESS